jgi:hypothetical protein
VQVAYKKGLTGGRTLDFCPLEMKKAPIERRLDVILNSL